MDRSTAPTIIFSPETLLKAQDVRIAFFDVDGVMTDGGVYFTEHGETLKRFSILDGYGIKLLRRAGITPVVITGRDSPPLRLRLKALGVEQARFGIEDKLPAAQDILQSLKADWSEAAYMGDDWPDLPVMTRCGFSCAPLNAHSEIRARVDHVTSVSGGFGAVREYADLLITARGKYSDLLRIAMDGIV